MEKAEEIRPCFGEYLDWFQVKLRGNLIDLTRNSILRGDHFVRSTLQLLTLCSYPVHLKSKELRGIEFSFSTHPHKHTYNEAFSKINKLLLDAYLECGKTCWYEAKKVNVMICE